MVSPLKQTEQEIRDLMTNVSKLEHSLKIQKDEHFKDFVKLYLEIIEVLDSFELKFKEYEGQNNHISDDVQTCIKEFKMTYKKLARILKNAGVEPITIQKGEEFNPACHKVSEMIEDSNGQNNTICDETLKGYMLNGELIRHSEVTIYKTK